MRSSPRRAGIVEPAAAAGAATAADREPTPAPTPSSVYWATSSTTEGSEPTGAVAGKKPCLPAWYWVVVWLANDSTQRTICRASSTVCWGCGGMGLSPHTPAPPDTILTASWRSVSSPAAWYFLAMAS